MTDAERAHLRQQWLQQAEAAFDILFEGQRQDQLVTFEQRETLTSSLGRELARIYVEAAPSLPLFASPLWGVFNTGRISGFPSRFSPYAGSSPGAHSDNLQVLVGVKPR